jgi:hypothetical protein
MKRSKSMYWKRFRVYMRRYFGHSLKVRRPKGLAPEVDTALRIWTRVVHEEDSELLYNPVTQECYAEWVDSSNPVYLFLESGRLRIVNTVIGYDVHLKQAEEDWCTECFKREVNRRRSEFKRIALGKVMHSLDDLEDRLSGKKTVSAGARISAGGIGTPTSNDYIYSQTDMTANR